MRAALPRETVKVTVNRAHEGWEALKGYDVNRGYWVVTLSLEKGRNFFESSSVGDLFEELLHPERYDSSQASKHTESFHGCKLQPFIGIFDQSWEQWDEAFHVNEFNTDLLVETILA